MKLFPESSWNKRLYCTIHVLITAEFQYNTKYAGTHFTNTLTTSCLNFLLYFLCYTSWCHHFHAKVEANIVGYFSCWRGREVPLPCHGTTQHSSGPERLLLVVVVVCVEGHYCLEAVGDQVTGSLTQHRLEVVSSPSQELACVVCV